MNENNRYASKSSGSLTGVGISISVVLCNYICNLQCSLRQRESKSPTPDIQSAERGLTSPLSTIVLVRMRLWRYFEMRFCVATVATEIICATLCAEYIKLQRTLLRQFNSVCLLHRLIYIDRASLYWFCNYLANIHTIYTCTIHVPATIIYALIISERSTEYIACCMALMPDWHLSSYHDCL